MFENIETLYDTQFSSGNIGFRIDAKGIVTCDDGMSLGHIEECLEEGKTIMELAELCQTIPL